MISLATMGKFWPQAGWGTHENDGIGGTGGGGLEYIQIKKPIVVVDRIYERNEKITVKVMGVKEW